jgi:hypothetical protein
MPCVGSNEAARLSGMVGIHEDAQVSKNIDQNVSLGFVRREEPAER